MKKRSFALLALGTVMAAALGVGTFTACKPAETEPESGYINGVNVFYGDGDEAHMQGWIVSETNDAWTVEENYVDEAAEGSPTVTKLGYSKNEAWRNFGVKIDGRYSDFAYLNVTMRAKTRGNSTRPVTVNMKIVNPITGKDDMNVLGSDLYFDVSSEEYVTYTFAIPHTYLQLMDVVTDVCLFPDPGIANSDTIYAGDIYVKDMWFSKTAPEDGYTPVMATGTQSYISETVAQAFGIEHLLATRPVEDVRGEFTGEFTGGFCYGVHKIDRLKEFCAKHRIALSDLAQSVTYTDSITDLPLLQFVESFHGHVVATNPDPQLKEQAQKSGWALLKLFDRA